MVPLDRFIENTIFESHVVLILHFDIYYQKGLQKDSLNLHNHAIVLKRNHLYSQLRTLWQERVIFEDVMRIANSQEERTIYGWDCYSLLWSSIA